MNAAPYHLLRGNFLCGFPSLRPPFMVGSWLVPAPAVSKLAIRWRFEEEDPLTETGRQLATG